jgi:2,3-bisphosphoglycerate-dependent phosphoglycerate mutase
LKTSELTRICFVRHGETDWNIERRMQGHIDLPLNANGEAQALAVGHFFSGFQADALYSSDLLRARQTAKPIADALQRPMNVMVALREQHFGRCEGKVFAEIAALNPDDAQALVSRDPDYATPGGGESRRQHEARILDCVAGLVSAHPGQVLVVVTHGGVLDVIYRRVHGLPPDAPRDYPIPNSGLNWVSITGDQWLIESWGETAHLA